MNRSLKLCSLVACLVLVSTCKGAYEPSIDGSEDVFIRKIKATFFYDDGRAPEFRTFEFPRGEEKPVAGIVIARSTSIGQMIHEVCIAIKEVENKAAADARRAKNRDIMTMTENDIEINIGHFGPFGFDEMRSLLDFEMELQTGRHQFYNASEITKGLYIVNDGKMSISVNRPRGVRGAAAPGAAAEPVDNSWTGYFKSFVPALPYWGGQK